MKGLCSEGNYDLEYDEKENSLKLETYELSNDKENDIKNYISKLIPPSEDVFYESSILPRGYIPSYFVQSNGSQMIYTGVTFDNNCSYGVTFEMIGEDSGWKHVVGCRDGSDTGIAIIDGKTHQIQFYGIELKTDTSASLKNYVEASSTLLKHNEFYKNINSTSTKILDNFCIFGKNNVGYSYAACKIYDFFIKKETEYLCKITPSLDTSGKICFYDFISGKEFSANNLIIGLTLEQSKKLYKLVEKVASLTVSLPTNYTEDQEVLSALDTARNKGWTLTIQTYDENSTSSASTFGMRRIWVRKSQDENGTYVDADGNRFQVEWCVEIYSPDNTTPEDHGYEQFRSVEAAVEYWELTPYVDPTLEEQFNSNEQEQ